MKQPPLLHRWLLRVVTPPDERVELTADLDDEWAQRAADEGPRAARAWYRRQARRSVLPLLGRRVPTVPRLSPMGVAQDLRLATRSLIRSPGFSLATMLMLAFGIGSFAVVYAFVDAIVVRPMPYGELNDRLVTVHSVHPTLTADPADAGMSYPDLLDLRSQSTALEGLEGALGRNIAVATDAATDRVLAASVTPGMFSMLGIEPRLGRTFTEADGAGAGFEQVVIVGHRIWRDLMGGDPAAVGRSVRINDRAVTVVGVMPPGFTFPEEHELWLPYASSPMAGRADRPWLAIGVIRAGLERHEAEAEMAGVVGRLAAQYPDINRDWGIAAFPLRQFFGSADDEGTVLAAVALLLLVACANVAGLILARGVARRRELTVRAALGASRGRLVRWLIGETAVLSLAGAGLGLLLASWVLGLLIGWLPEPPAYWAVPALDARVVGVAMAVTAGVAVLSGLAPAVGLSNVAPAGVLAAGARASGGSVVQRRIQLWLVVGQVALSFSLVIGALLLAQSASALLSADAGFDHEPVLSARFYIAGDRYDDLAARTALIDDVVARVSAVPGVRAAAATGTIPSDDGGADERLVPPPGATFGGDEVGAQLIPVTPSFWQAIDRPLLEGRTFTSTEAAAGGPDVVIVNQRLADAFWPARPALGRVLTVLDDGRRRDFRVVGVAPDLVYEEFGEITPQSRLNLYVPYPVAGWRTQALMINVERGRDPAGLADAVRTEVRRVDSGLAVYDVRSMVDRRAYNHWGNSFVGQTMTGLALAALLLACVGAYGIASHAVAARRREIGVRMAIGASAGDIRRLFLGTGVKLAVGGLALGLPLAIAMARLLESMLFGVSPWDGRLWTGLPPVLLAAILLASYWPARRASRMNPAITLKD